MSGMVYVPPTPLPTIKSIQRGVATVSTTALPTTSNITISAVDITKSFVSCGGFVSVLSAAASSNGFGAKARLTSATNLEVITAGSSGASCTLNWEVIEFN